MILRLLNAQGIIGLAMGSVLAILFAVQLAQTRHWKKQSAGFEQLYRQEQTAAAVTATNLRAAAEAGPRGRPRQHLARRRRAARHQRKDRR